MLTIPELTDTNGEESILHAWTRFGKLLHLNGRVEKANLHDLKATLLKRASFRVDPLQVGKNFMKCIQG